MNKLITAFKAFFTKQSVEDILASFTKTIQELETHVEAKVAASGLYQEWVDKYTKAKAEALEEVAKGKKAINKLKAFLD